MAPPSRFTIDTLAPLDRSNPDSRYLQLAGVVAEGELPLGQRLPSERELARTLGVSRPTVMTACRELGARGVVRGRVGRGTFVGGEQRVRLCFAGVSPTDIATGVARLAQAFRTVGQEAPRNAQDGLMSRAPLI